MKKRLGLIMILVSMLFVCCKNNENSDKIKIGAAIALTGFGSDFGQSEKNAIEFLKEKYGDDIEIEFYIEDTKSDVKSGITAIKKLIDVNKCNIIYCELSSIVSASLPIISKTEVTLIAPVYLEDLNGNPNAIRNLPSANQENAALLSFLNNNSIVHDKIAVLYSNDVFGQTCYNSFKNLLPNNCVISYSDAINEEALRETALKVIRTNPDVIYLGSMSESLGLLVKFLKQNGYSKEIITTDAFSYDYINSLAGEYAKGVHYVDFQENEKYDVFKESYNKKFGIKCVPSAMLCYDGISAIVSAIIDKKEFNESTYDGLTGELQIKNNEIIYPIQVLTWE
jgi:ABC-type branched-subunit amino acid transport system substrate-binding protein